MKILECEFPKNALITQHIPDKILDGSIRYFDRDGYELTEVEMAIHEFFSIEIGDCLNHHSVCQNWIEFDEFPIMLDHSFISARYGYDEEAKEAIKKKAEKDPRFLKMLSLRPKFGIDISLDFVYEGRITELVHIEADFTNIAEAIDAKEQAEEILSKVDFMKKAEELISLRSEWESLQSDDQSDYKARHFGFNRAFDNIKAYV